MAKVGLRKGDRRRIGPPERKERSRNRTKAVAENQAAMQMAGSPNQSWRGPSSSTYSSPPRKTAIAARCE